MEIISINSQLEELSVKILESFDRLYKIKKEIEIIQDMAATIFPDLTD